MQWAKHWSRKFLTLLLWMGSVCAYAQSDNTPLSLQELIAKNHELMNQTEVLQKKTKSCAARKQIDSTEAIEVLNHLSEIMSTASRRRVFYYDLKHVQSSIMPVVLHKKKLKRSCDRVTLENFVLEKDMGYCAALSSCLEKPENFLNNKRAYFNKGKYEIPKKYWAKAKDVYEPILDSIIAIAKKNPQEIFKAKIITMGYSDASPKRDNETLYEEMREFLMSDNLTDDEINMYLSNLRAYTLNKVIYDTYKERKRTIKKMGNLSVRFEQQGKGTALPDPRIKFGPEDRRRRVALVKWHILPKF